MATNNEVTDAQKEAVKTEQEAAKNAPKVITGKKHKLSTHEQGQLARGEIDESGEATDKPTKPKKERVKSTGETLYQGMLTGHSVSDLTGEEISFRWDQKEPATKEGCFYTFQNMHGAGANRDKFELDPDNKTDPTLRTHLE